MSIPAIIHPLPPGPITALIISGTGPPRPATRRKTRRKRATSPGQGRGRVRSHLVSEPLCQESWAWADLIDTSDELALFQRPHLDILSYFPVRQSLSQIDHASAHVLNTGMHLPAAQSLFVATYTVDGASLAARGHQVAADAASGRILRSVLMKPETEQHVPALHQQVLNLVAGS